MANGMKKGAIGWFIDNPVAANILMIFLIVGGLYWSTQIKQEVFPEFTIDSVIVEVAYPGASPDEIEKGILLPIEEAVDGLDGIKKVTSTANEGVGEVVIEATLDADINQLYQDVKSEIDRITTFPEDAEEPKVYIPSRKREVITLILYGNQDEKVLREWADNIKDRLLQYKNISSVELLGDKPYEIKIELDRDVLRKFNLTISDVANKIKNYNLELPAGKIETAKGDILIRVTERREYGKDLKDIPIVLSDYGRAITLGEIAKISDNFEETNTFLKYNDLPAIGIRVYRVGDQKPIEIAETVKKFIKEINNELPPGLYTDYVNDRSKIFAQRIDLLLRNAKLGLILVFSLLALFLEIRLAFWVMLGIPISFLGSMLLFPQFDVSINMVSLFAFIICLGIVVDDAIVVGENIYRYRQQGLPFKKAALIGGREVMVPVIFSVLTNMVAFLPMYFVPGVMGKIFRIIPVIVVSVFTISLLESLFILPSHIGHQKEEPMFILKMINRVQQTISKYILKFIHSVYGPILKFCIRFRYVTFVFSLMVLIVAVSFVKSGRIGIVFFPKVESDFAYVKFVLPVESSVFDTLRVAEFLTEKAKKIIEENGGEKLAQGILTNINNNSGFIQVYLSDPDVRPITTTKFTNLWRKESKDLTGIKTIKFFSDFGGPGHGASLTVELQHRNIKTLRAASKELANYLATFNNVSDIDEGFADGKLQFDIKLNDKGKALGIDSTYLARQLRNYYYGAEAKRFLRGTDEVKIMVRADAKERDFEYFFKTFLVDLPNGSKVPLKEIAEIKRGRSYTTIDRRNFRRIINVTANVTPENQTNKILEVVKSEFLPELQRKFPGLNYSFEGKQSDMRDSMSALFKGLLVAIMVIYVMLAIPFKSYFQPLIIMTVIPFGIIGALVGHILLGYDLNLVSMFGIVALAGVVINDSLVLIDFANRKRREENATFHDAIYEAGLKRFRPILLTTLTTFFGLMPMIFETSVQARFLIPMAISLGFGILFSTFIVLILVPGLYVIIEDAIGIAKKLF
ncbi:RND efflux system, multidrug efflux transporter [Deferribacter desulfuricans SSM1]|uniref:RND efflux system, multidrug efflux transporter n=1 Tax=Deferribacter desulfuricans (strain DSM 14783 / JCM 11476 / NBRC 101012 / SSM1) TaxID=639282 RepID=D3P9G9_DEFDS|nr:efflux RND transporter permease subunit [Deferribacter desulfuricans]BAI81359.1 RND efflux system, multidrug efflux transporter [Deferribacter desulfuricans SSM1]